MSKHFLTIGAGFTGATVARQLVEGLDCRVTVLEERPHLAGNCHSYRDPATGVMVHAYGPHIFHTDREDVWEYVNRFEPFQPFINRIKASSARGIFTLPINLHTINQFFNRRFTPQQARAFLHSLGDHSIGEPANFEQQALKSIGRELYEAFFYGYTLKQWGCEPRELPAAILKRLPIRFDYNDNYYTSAYQGIPRGGYTQLVEKLLDHPRIEVQLATRFDPGMTSGFTHTIYTGPLDGYFGYSHGRLGYRTVTFERIEAEGDYQGNPILNYPDLADPFTRIYEHKHFAPWESHARTVAFREFSKETGPGDVPYYPKRLAGDMERLRDYQRLAGELKEVTFLGRLATYRYLDMDVVVGEALDFSRRFLAGAL